MKKIRIAPSILNADFAHLEKEIRRMENAGVDWIHLDIMDGHFVPNLTFGAPVVEKLRSITGLPFDAHLMIENPERYLKDFREAGVNWLTVHVEVGYHLHRTIDAIRKLGMHPGVAINPGTPAAWLDPLLPFVDLILVMTVNPGFGGQKFIPEMLDKIRDVAGKIRDSGREILLEVDGGLDQHTVPAVLESGADVLVIGSAIFEQPDPQQAAAGFVELVSSR
ncbi:MAG TPA: ribulose-phosphate 3-epimerase [Bacteroidetes bacterium]|nr:ribulose-phosphate 3-epimerase [Bacteroidota bacterium]